MSLTKERARVAALSRSRTNDDPDLIEARQTLKAERLTQYVGRALEQAPPLTPSQLSKLGALIRGGNK